MSQSLVLERASQMPNGFIPTYSYRPAVAPSVPVKLRSLSSRRGRLFAGGTYFRSIDPGRTANNITVQIVKEDGIGYLIVVNQNLQYDENVLGPAGIRTRILDLTGSNWNDLVRIDSLDGTPLAHYYSIRCSIAFARQNGSPYTLPTPIETAPFASEKLFARSGKLAVKIEKSTANFTAGSVISIAPRFRIYKLSALSIPPGVDSAGLPTLGYDGYDIVDMRSQVNATNTWVQMLERSGTPTGTDGVPGTPPAVKFDEQDDRVDDPVGSEFAQTNLSGGDGLPENPTLERTGPSRSIVFVNYGEKYNGSLGETNTVYEWVGSDAIAGEWKAY